MATDVPFSEYAEINPRRPLSDGWTYPFVEMAAVRENGGGIAGFGQRPFTGGGSRFREGDTLFARITPCTENGKVALVGEVPGGGPAFGSTEFIVLAPRDGRATSRFVHQVAKSEHVRRLAVARMLGTSGRQRVPSWFFTDELTLPRFTLAEQHAIAAILDAIDAAIERSESVVAATEALRRTLLDNLFTRGAPGWHTTWKPVPGLGTVPACWRVSSLGDVARFRSGQGARGSELQHQSERNRFAVFGGNGIAGYWPEALISERVVVIGRVGQKCGVVRTTDGPAWITDNALYNHTIQDGVSVDFLALVAQRARLNGIRNRNDLPLITQEIVHRVPVALPPRAEQDAITSLLETCDSAIASAQRALVALVATKEAVANALLSGRVRSTETAPPAVPC